MRLPLFDEAPVLATGTSVTALSTLHPSLFYTAVEQSSVAISITDPNARIVYTNHAFRQLTGYSDTELTGVNHNILASRQTPNQHYQEMWHTLTQGRPWVGQLINQRKNGTLYLAEVSISPVLSPDGHIEHYLGMHKDISDSYALMQRLRNQMSLIAAVLNNVPAPVIVLDEFDNIVMDNLAYKTLCADYGGQELLAGLGYPANKARLAAGERVTLNIGGGPRVFGLSIWPLSEVNEEVSRYFSDIAPPRTLITLIDDSERHRQRQRQRLERLKHKLVSGKLLAAIRESLDAAMVQLSGPLNMLEAARRLNPDQIAHPGLDAAWHEGQQALVRLRACRPSLEVEECDFWSISEMLTDLSDLYRARISAVGELRLQCEPDIVLGWGQRHQILACLSLWLDRCLTLAGERPAVPLEIALQAYGRDHAFFFDLRDNLPLYPTHAGTPPQTFATPGHGMELRLIQTLIGSHQGMIDIHTQEEDGTLLTLRLPLPVKSFESPAIIGEAE
ncbi:nitrogen fixation negative regulator NifL [Acerihabitans sp. TG2]|uniref:nitrogen fixation negative regulator NifL n=1 Tax=Acerihabitans sp. TG2 TaxID=3096008 RepID=UPI002B230314|nr:nitrogen fixation negative regulator NifL [Acerihabitans sp. TG2]MEA9393236.1 nitrogen fixation negative regulator NifL [Acerihabitans sp. TG2]